MEFFFSCFLLFSARLLLASSLVPFQDNGLTPKQANIHLELHHVHAQLNHSAASNLPFFSPEILEKDEQRVEAIHLRFSNKNSSNMMNKPELVSTPLKSGLSIGSGNYYVKLGIGNPPQYSSLIVDTGSALSWLQCEPCEGYCHSQVDPLFNPSKSKTYKKFPCSSSSCSSLKGSTLNDPVCEVGACVYRAAYGDSSFSIGYLSQDLLTLTPSDTLPGFVYGCGRNNQGLFGRSSGILGLDHDKLSALAQLSTKYGYAFSYCLPTSFSATKPPKGGYLSIGSSSLTKSPFKFTPMVKNPKVPSLKNPKVPSLYFVDLTAIKVAGRPLSIAASSYKVPTILDSGTVITRLPMSVYTALKEAFVKIMSKKYKPTEGISILDTCFEGSAKEIVNVAEIDMIFEGGAALPLKGHNTLIEVDNKTTCLAIAGTSGNPPIAIIGNYQQQTFDVAYDISNSRIGFSPAGCE